MVGSTKEPDWKFIEKIATLLEKSLSPSASVKHDVKLPVIGKPQRKPRQCDIVLTQGESPRQTVTIVEVQKRNRKPEINTFHGWIKKMREVGAQHLICVSALGYPRSIIDAVATEYGPTVRLLTIKELEQPEILNLSFLASHMLHKKPHIRFEAIGRVQLETTRHAKELPKLPFKGNDAINHKMFEVQGANERLTLTDLMTKALPYISYQWSEAQQAEPITYTFELDLAIDGWDLLMYVGEEHYKVRHLPVKVSIENSFHKVPLTCYEYQQEFNDGVLAWVVSARGIIDTENVDIKLIFKPDKDGLLQLNSVLGTQNLELIFSTDKTTLASFIAKRYPNHHE